MNEEALDEIFADLAADLPDLDDGALLDKIDAYDLDDDDKVQLYQLAKDLQTAESGQPLDLPQDMANEDNTEVKVTKEDKDGDGDTDKMTTEKTDPKDDDKVSKEEKKLADDITSEDNSNESEDKPHDENKTNQIANTLANYKW
jgi:hypothetical protein